MCPTRKEPGSFGDSGQDQPLGISIDDIDSILMGPGDDLLAMHHFGSTQLGQASSLLNRGARAQSLAY
jgi:hypothetical protein